MAKIKSHNKMTVRTPAEAEALMELVRHSARKVHDWVAAQVGDPLDMLERMKFEPVGFHPIEHYALNLVEQINQTWTYAVAIAAAKHLLQLTLSISHLCSAGRQGNILGILGILFGSS
jgi:hypothetical protein